jgi:signal peptidase I
MTEPREKEGFDSKEKIFHPLNRFMSWASVKDTKFYLYHLVRKTVYIILVIFLFKTFIFSISVTQGVSMLPTLQDNSAFLVNKFIYLFRTPARGDIIQVYLPETKTHYVKRIVGLPNEKLSFSGDQVCISTITEESFCLEEDYLPEGTMTRPPTGEDPNHTIPENSYFVLGDNRNSSTDSRTLGSIPREHILGEVVWILN